MEEQEKKKIIPIVIEGFEINAQNVTFQKLQEFSLILFEKLLELRKERSFLTLERDKLRTVLENVHHEVQVTNAILTNTDDELELAQGRYRLDFKEIEEEVKYIHYNHSLSLSEFKKWEENLMLQNEREYSEERSELLNEKRQLKLNLNHQKLKSVESLRDMKIKNAAELEILKDKHKEMRLEKDLEYSTNFKSTIEHVTLKHEMEMFELEERKNTHLAQLKTINRNRVEEIKRFFNSITAENLVLISDLKLYLESLKKSKHEMSNEEKFLKEENKKYQELLNNARLQVNDLKRQLVNYEKDLVSLKHNKWLLNRTETETKNVKHNTLNTLKKIKEKENLDSIKDLYSKFLNNMSTITVEKRHNLEKLISLLIEEIRNKHEIIHDLSCDPDIRQAVSKLKFELWNPRKLSYELAVICKAHDDLLKALWQKLKEFCVQEETLGHSLLDIENIGKTTSSFISKQ